MSEAPSSAAPTSLWERARRWTWLRLVVMTFTLFAAYVGLQLLALVFGLHPAPAARMAIRIGDSALIAVCMPLAYLGLVRAFERRRVTELSLGRGAPLFWIGVVFGAALFAVVMSLLWRVGAASFAGAGRAHGVVVALVLAIAAAIGEEIVFRGALFRILEQGFGTLAATLVSGALFGLVHALNPGANLVSTIAIALEAGVLLALVYAVVRNLWLPIGVHLGWNFTEGGVFSQAVSGGGSGSGLVAVRLHGPPWLSGGAFGPEASIIAVGVSLLASVLLAAWLIRTGGWRPARLRATLD
ncbi:MAG TPA: type II CAAX endopeptidase family protein [Caulobacteraceae bacterium]|nr:type II CAAX endopeptidase family protein [Caulobacteraceae bacterium]